MANVVIINPRFANSFWGMERAMPLLGKQANLPVACLPLLAALTPAPHTVTLIDENVEAIDYDQLKGADIVALTGMNVQRFRMTEILKELKARGHFTAVGGGWVTLQEDYFGELADVIFVGEAEETWPRFLQEWPQGKHARRYEQEHKTDMTKLPTPRFDLLKMDRYMFGSVQFSRGCPFQCEFCDIIVTFGRRPRLKTTTQVIAELEALKASGLRLVFIVDDNLVGNKRAIKPVLAEVARWQQANGYPMVFFTEASLDLAEDSELLQLMDEANFVSVFVGIESPNEESLKETKKYQNVKKNTTILDRVEAIQNHGMEVWCGMIVGFDNDDPTIFQKQEEFLIKSGIIHPMLGMLTALPKTPLYDRLASEGRVDLADEQREFGTNILPLRMTREGLRDGYIDLMNRLYDPKAYFERLAKLYIERGHRYHQARERYFRRHRGLKARHVLKHVAMCLGLFWRLMRQVKEKELRREYRRWLWTVMKHRPEPGVIFHLLVKCAMHYHLYNKSRDMRGGENRVVNVS